MASKVQTILVDDITGKEIAAGEGETISFAINGTEYTIDLDAKNTKKFYDAIAPYQDHATRIGRAKVTQMRRGRKNDEVDNAAVRAWAESNGYDVSSRGRIKGEIVEAFRAANA